MFCDNEKCQRHIQWDNKPYGIFIENGNKNEIKRYQYKKSDGTKTLYLCETCHSAVQLIGGV